jgi:hypothetical protein
MSRANKQLAAYVKYLMCAGMGTQHVVSVDLASRVKDERGKKRQKEKRQTYIEVVVASPADMVDRHKHAVKVLRNGHDCACRCVTNSGEWPLLFCKVGL